MEIRRWSLGLLEKETLKEGFKKIGIANCSYIEGPQPPRVKKFRKSYSEILYKIREIKIEKPEPESEAILWLNWWECLEYNDENFEKMLSEFKELNNTIDKRDRKIEKELALKRLQRPGAEIINVVKYKMMEKFLEKYQDFILAVVQEEKIQYASVFNETSNYALAYVFGGKPIFDFTGCKTKRQLNNFFTFVKLWLKMFTHYESTKRIGYPTKCTLIILKKYADSYIRNLAFAQKVYKKLKERKKGASPPTNSEIKQVSDELGLPFSVVQEIAKKESSQWAHRKATEEIKQKTGVNISEKTLRRLYYTTAYLRKRYEDSVKDFTIIGL